MFAFADTPVKFVGLLILFAWCTLWSIYELTRPQDARQRISNALHLVMAVVSYWILRPHVGTVCRRTLGHDEM